MRFDEETMTRAVESRERRFDGWFILAVTSTGIYCRPSCPAVSPRRDRMRFYPTTAAAQAAGYRACKRCRPDAVPGSPEWDARADVVGRAMRAIRDGVVDRDGIDGLSGTLHVSSRQLHRMFVAELGTGPLAVARAQRAQTARTLIETTEMTMSDVAYAAGFTSIRQFNETVAEVFARPPTALRANARRGRRAAPDGGALTLRLPYREPFDAASVFDLLAARAIPGVETWDGTTYRRSLSLPGGDAVVALRPAAGHVACSLRLDSIADLGVAVARCRRLLDLDADVVSVAEQLRGDPVLEPLVARRPGLRSPGAVDAFEVCIRAVLNQQISIAAARTHAGRLVARVGRALVEPQAGITHVFPSAEMLAELPDDALAMPAARRRTIRAVARAVVDGDLVLDPGVDRGAATAALLALPGVGPWTAAYVAMRGLGDPDVLIAGDLGVATAAARLGLPRPPAALAARGASWSPWRTYATHHLWASLIVPSSNDIKEER